MNLFFKAFFVRNLQLWIYKFKKIHPLDPHFREIVTCLATDGVTQVDYGFRVLIH